MKKLISITIALVVALSVCAFSLSACAQKDDDGRIKIVATIFPEYDWIMNVLGDNKDNAEVTLLIDSGADLHSYQPTVADIATVSSCDLFVYVGGESDEWTEDALKNAVNENMKTINLLETLGDKAKTEETVDGMQNEHEGSDDGDEETEYDEHVWLSLKNASIFVDTIADVLCETDKENASSYRENAAAYKLKLSELDLRYEAAVAAANIKTLLFADRFPFRYLVDDYGLNYYAAFSGCSAETEASFETVIFLAGKIDELSLSSIMKLESSDGKIARTVRDNTANKDQRILTLNSLQSCTLKDYSDGKTYLSLMTDNLSVLTDALS